MNIESFKMPQLVWRVTIHTNDLDQSLHNVFKIEYVAYELTNAIYIADYPKISKYIYIYIYEY